MEDREPDDRADPDLGDVVGALDAGLVAIEQQRRARTDHVGEDVVGRGQQEQPHDARQLAQRERVALAQEVDHDDVRLAQVEAQGGQWPEQHDVPGHGRHVAHEREVAEDPDDHQADDEQPNANGGIQPGRPWHGRGQQAEVRQSARLIVSMSAIRRVGACMLVDWGVPWRSVSPRPSSSTPTRKSYARNRESGPGRGRSPWDRPTRRSLGRLQFSASDDRIRVRVDRCRTAGRPETTNMTFMVQIPLDARAEGQGHRRQKRHGHGEARQVRLHGTYLVAVHLATVNGGRAVSRRRSLALRPRLATGLPWTMAIAETSFVPCSKCGRTMVPSP